MGIGPGVAVDADRVVSLGGCLVFKAEVGVAVNKIFRVDSERCIGRY